MDNTDGLLHYIANHQPEVIFFDIGNVLVEIDFQEQNKLTVERFQLNQEQYKAFLMKYFHDYLTGALTSNELDTHFQQAFHVKESLTNYWLTTYKQLYKVNEQLIDQLASLSTTSQLSIVSNIFPESLQELQSTDLLDKFIAPVYSCEVGFTKPDPQIFRCALMQFPDQQPAECLFVDDKNKHLQSAHQIGMNTYRYTKYTS